MDPSPDSSSDRPAPVVRQVARSRAWWFVAAGRIAMLAAAAAGAALAVSRSSGGDVPTVAERYRCPMHPEVETAAPASCPICGMALVRDHTAAAAMPAGGRDPAPPPVARTERRTFSETVRAPAWIEPDGDIAVLVYRDDLVGVAPDQPAVFFPARDPAHGIEVAVTAAPPTAWDDSTAHVHVRVVRDAALRPGDHGVVVLAPTPRALQIVPASAVLDAPDGPYVLALDPRTHRFARRRVQLGRARHGVVAVLSGLSDGEPVLATGVFFRDLAARTAPEATP